jgi:hypothetical protein
MGAIEIPWNQSYRGRPYGGEPQERWPKRDKDLRSDHRLVTKHTDRALVIGVISVPGPRYVSGRQQCDCGNAGQEQQPTLAVGVSSHVRSLDY